jgi:uncharacterized protein YsxB (DUF464 family)
MNYCHITKSNRIEKVIITNHAEAGEYGQDIICAAISAVSITIAEQIITIDKAFALEMDEEEARMVFSNNLSNDKIDLLLETLVTGMKMIASTSPQYIKIEVKNTEV